MVIAFCVKQIRIHAFKYKKKIEMKTKSSEKKLNVDNFKWDIKSHYVATKVLFLNGFQDHKQLLVCAVRCFFFFLYNDPAKGKNEKNFIFCFMFVM